VALEFAGDLLDRIPAGPQQRVGANDSPMTVTQLVAVYLGDEMTSIFGVLVIGEPIELAPESHQPPIRAPTSPAILMIVQSNGSNLWKPSDRVSKAVRPAPSGCGRMVRYVTGKPRSNAATACAAS
jgi:hypothetical protein